MIIKDSPAPQDQQLQHSGIFPQTRWSLIVDARGQDAEALASLCQQYWKPLYVYARKKGSNSAEAEDLTQSFFVRVLSKELFEKAVPERGRLRTLLLSSFQNFIISEWKKENSLKRGGGVSPVSIDAIAGEEWIQGDSAGEATPEAEFERSWAREILAQATAKLAADYEKVGKTAEFEVFADQLEQGREARPYSELAEQLDIDVSTARYMSFKLRQRFRDTLGKVVADTVTTDEEAAEEMQHLLTVFESP